MRRGEIWLVNLDPAMGSEMNKRRPAVIVSNNGANAVAGQFRKGVVTVVPVSSNVSRVFPFQVLLEPGTTGLRAGSKAQAEQVRSVSVDRLGPRIGYLPAPALKQLDDALRLHLGL